jgi:subfamily B ATP-binding cassette protein MsbA
MPKFILYLRDLLVFAFPYIRRYQVRFILGILLGLGFAASNGLIVGATQFLVGRLTPGTPVEDPNRHPALQALFTALDPWTPAMGQSMTMPQVVGGILLLGCLAALRGGLGFASTYCMTWASERMSQDLRCDIVSKLNSLSFDYFSKTSTGDMLTRINTDAGQVQRAFVLGIPDLVKEPVTLIFVATALAWVDSKLALIAFVFMPLCVVPIFVLGRKIRRASQSQVKTHVSQSSLMIQTLANIRVVKAFGLEQDQNREFRRLADKLVGHNIRATKAKELVNPIIETIGGLSFGLTFVYAVYSAHTVDNMAAFFMALALAFNPVKKIAALNSLLQQTSVGVGRIFDLLRETPTVQDRPGALVLPPFHQAIEFRGVSFGYGPDPVLHTLDLVIPKGTHLGIAGESGSGKSTLLNLLFRFYDVTSGSLRIDGHDVREVTVASLRAQMALVSQEVLLFNRSVAENIACGRPGATREEIEAAARAAHAHNFISALPEGYDTVVGEWGARLSGGQRQRIALARAFVRNAPILVLDEATAALDSTSEAEIQSALEQLSVSRTVITVAHRLSTLRTCDRIIVLEKGHVVESGTFAELLALRGRFATMAVRQGLTA